MVRPGQIVILNGAPRSGKTSVARALQALPSSPFVNIGVDGQGCMIPPSYQPGIGLRPGGERPDIEVHLPRLFAALYGTIAVYSRLGLDVVADLGLHNDYVQKLDFLKDGAECLNGLPVLFVGVFCPLEEIMARRAASEAHLYLQASEDDPFPAPVRRWQDAVHEKKNYDLTIDTSKCSPQEAADAILAKLIEPSSEPRSFARMTRP